MLAWAEHSGLHAGVRSGVNGIAGPVKDNLAAELEDVQAQFEAYKAEMGVDSAKLGEELQQAYHDLGQVNVTLEKAKAKIEHLTGKYSYCTSCIQLFSLSKTVIVRAQTKPRYIPRSRQLDKAETDRTTRENEVRLLEPRAFVSCYYSVFVTCIFNVFSLRKQSSPLETLQQQLSVSQATSRENLSEVANTQAKLAPSEGSWRQQKEALDREIADLNAWRVLRSVYCSS